MGFLTELPSSLSPLLSRAEDMSQPVTTPSSFELASKLEELSGLASQIVRLSNELRAVSPRDFPADSASVCALLPAALSNAQSCLSILQFINQAPISPPYDIPFSNSALIDCFSQLPSFRAIRTGYAHILTISHPCHCRGIPPSAHLAGPTSPPSAHSSH